MKFINQQVHVFDTAMIAMNTMRRVMSIMSNATSHRRLSTIKNTKVEIQESSEIIVLGPSITSTRKTCILKKAMTELRLKKSRFMILIHRDWKSTLVTASTAMHHFLKSQIFISQFKISTKEPNSLMKMTQTKTNMDKLKFYPVGEVDSCQLII